MHGAAPVLYKVTPDDFYRLGASAHYGPAQAGDCVAVDGEERAPGDTPDEGAAETSTELHEASSNSVCVRPSIDMSVFCTQKPVLCWDTETAGLGKPAICQLAYVLVSADGSQREYSKIWQLPADVYISKNAIEIHGITPEQCRKGCYPVAEILEFWELVNRVLSAGGVVLGHNIQFDCRAFNFTSEKWNVPKTVEHKHMLDTMKESKAYSTLTNVKGYKKPFKNAELCTPAVLV
jgi:hypothetical protein